jgi:hypothetical protein
MPTARGGGLSDARAQNARAHLHASRRCLRAFALLPMPPNQALGSAGAVVPRACLSLMHVSVYVCVRVCRVCLFGRARVCAPVSVRVCVRACVLVCAGVCVYVHPFQVAQRAELCDERSLRIADAERARAAVEARLVPALPPVPTPHCARSPAWPERRSPTASADGADGRRRRRRLRPTRRARRRRSPRRTPRCARRRTRVRAPQRSRRSLGGLGRTRRNRWRVCCRTNARPRPRPDAQTHA